MQAQYEENLDQAGNDLLDELEAAQEEAATITAKELIASAAAPDLDDLLSESVSLADALKAKRKGVKLSAEQQEILESNRLAEEAAVWQDTAMFAHIAVVKCQCGSHSPEFRGWYLYQKHSKGSGRRLIQSPDNKGMEVRAYHTQECATICPACLPVFPSASPAECDLLESLGCCSTQFIATAYDGELGG